MGQVKKKPAGKNDKIDVTYTHFAANNEKTELKTGKGEKFDNDLLLETLGFKENSEGVMSLSVSDNEAIRDDKGKIVSRRTTDGRVLTDESKKEDLEK